MQHNLLGHCRRKLRWFAILTFRNIPIMVASCFETMAGQQRVARLAPASFRCKPRRASVPPKLLRGSGRNLCCICRDRRRLLSRHLPTDSRAHARSRLMREIQGKESSYFLDWEAVEVPNQKRTRLLNPFQP